MTRLFGIGLGFLGIMALIGMFIGWATFEVKADDDYPVANMPIEWTEDGGVRLKRLVIVDALGNPAIILRTVNGKGYIIVLSPGETEDKALLDIAAGRTVDPRRIPRHDWTQADE